jgi:hypothetical protein
MEVITFNTQNVLSLPVVKFLSSSAVKTCRPPKLVGIIFFNIRRDFPLEIRQPVFNQNSFIIGAQDQGILKGEVSLYHWPPV